MVKPTVSNDGKLLNVAQRNVRVLSKESVDIDLLCMDRDVDSYTFLEVHHSVILLMYMLTMFILFTFIFQKRISESSLSHVMNDTGKQLIDAAPNNILGYILRYIILLDILLSIYVKSRGLSSILVTVPKRSHNILLNKLQVTVNTP